MLRRVTVLDTRRRTRHIYLAPPPLQAMFWRAGVGEHGFWRSVWWQFCLRFSEARR